ncbi:MAG: hypothetical protein AABY89_04280 [Acidobacteriota bacterium]
MNASRAAVMVVGVNMVAVWMAAAAGRSAMADQVPLVASRAVIEQQEVHHARASLVAATERLDARDQAPGVPEAVARNPFRFGAARTAAPLPAHQGGEPATSAGRVQDTATRPDGAAGQDDMRLEGMAETRVGDEVRRTAIMTTGGAVVLATIGTELSGRYKVIAIGADSVDLDDVRGGPRRVLKLSSHV